MNKINDKIRTNWQLRLLHTKLNNIGQYFASVSRSQLAKQWLLRTRQKKTVTLFIAKKLDKRYDGDGFENHKSAVKRIHIIEKNLIKNTTLFFLSANEPAMGPIIATKKPVIPIVQPQ